MNCSNRISKRLRIIKKRKYTMTVCQFDYHLSIKVDYDFFDDSQVWLHETEIEVLLALKQDLKSQIKERQQAELKVDLNFIYFAIDKIDLALTNLAKKAQDVETELAVMLE